LLVNALAVVKATDEEPRFAVGDELQIAARFPIGHYRVPFPLRGKRGIVEAIVKPGIDNEEAGYGRNAGLKRHYYRLAIPLRMIWPGYRGPDRDSLRIEVFESWLERV
jgi:nitrile hydratase